MWVAGGNIKTKVAVNVWAFPLELSLGTWTPGKESGLWVDTVRLQSHMASHTNNRVSKNSTFVRVLWVFGWQTQYTAVESLLHTFFSAVLCEVISNTVLYPYDVSQQKHETSLVLLIFCRDAVFHVISRSFTAKCLALTLSKLPGSCMGLSKG